jgi:hypothetical protein
VAVVDAGAAVHPAWLEPSRTQATTEGGTFSVEQGRELARLQVQEMTRKIHARAKGQRLNRGLTISLPYFDDGALELRWREVVVIPRGRIPFVPAFVVLASRQEIARVGMDARLSESTRAHLVEQLETLAKSFEA